MKNTIGFAHEQIVLNDKRVRRLDENVYSGNHKNPAQEAFITCDVGRVRYLYHNGGKPSQAVGHVLGVGENVRLRGIQQVRDFVAVATSEEVAVLSVTYERC